MSELPPGLFLILGALVMPLVPRRYQSGIFLVFPALALVQVWTMPIGAERIWMFLDYELVIARVDALSRVFGIVFALVALVGGIYAWHVEGTGERSAALGYAGGGLGVVFAGDFFTLLVWWEIMAMGSTLLIWSRRTKESDAAGMRYLLVHLFGGSLLMAGILLHWATTGSLTMTAFSPGESVAAWLMLGGVAINAAIPPLHAWLSDAYPRATVAGAVFLSAFTTKSSVYVLCRLYPGWDILIYFGVFMALYGVVYAVLANDIRQILAYHIISQVGYMVAGVGLGTALALNGTAAHAFSHILYKGLLFMGAGAVLYTTGKSKLTDLGGIWRFMPLTVALYMIGAFSISGFPLFNGFISKSIIVSAAGYSHHYWVMMLLFLASVGTFLHTGLKLPYFTWWGPDSGARPHRKVPVSMLIAMGLLAFFCTLFGVAPGLLYAELPHDVIYRPYTIPHLVEATQILIFTFVAFWMLRPMLAGEAKEALDADWFYRRPAGAVRRIFVGGVNGFFEFWEKQAGELAAALARKARNPRSWIQRETGDFDPNRQRTAIGLGITCTVLIALILALWGMV